MNVMVLIYAIASIGLFSTRAFLPAFIVALLLRFGPSIGWLADLGVFASLSGAPAWFTSDASLTILGFLAVAEIAANKFPEVRRLLSGVDPAVKTVMVVLTALGVASAADAEFIALALAAEGAGGALLTTLPAAVGTFGVSAMRSGVVTAFGSADEDDVLGLQRLMSWLEDFAVLAGALLVLVLPVLVLLLVGLGTAALYGLRRMTRRWDEAQKISCEGCSTPIYRDALVCPSCGIETPAARAPDHRREAWAASDLIPRKLDLLERRRCPSCASHHKKGALDPCSVCGAQLLGDPILAVRYRDRIDSRLPPILSFCAVLGLVPIVGAVAGILYYRLRLVGPLRIWVPATRGIPLRFALAAAQFALLTLQSVPLFGALMVPGMAFLAFRFYQPAFDEVVRPLRPSQGKKLEPIESR